jgi:predicted kinase
MLVVFSGLPGTGKTVLAEFTGQTCQLPVFSVAWVIGALSPLDMLDRENRGPIAYAVLTMLARRQFDLGQSAVLDGMCGQESVREEWHRLAERYGALFLPVECVCSDAQLHRHRIEARHDNIPGWPDPGWEHVEEMRGRYETWSSPRLVIDAVNPLSENQGAVLRYLETGSACSLATPDGP